ncbi:islet cell autoantigen 1-like protein [Leptopilina heterotoma]|uniref:islet cell autoantigen 1-like protein n=1 Tax=Leptopilina heterotoma TaxID=63436 RepID=UPI001CAA3407|nr:islet cell autoantigen 1-like protein [Leptopilina heterotoma]
MNTYDRGGAPGISGNSFDRWVQKSNMDDSAITKMQHHYWVTKQALSRKLGKKDDECIVSSDAELDAKLALFRSIQESCAFLQRVIDKYQERLCNLAQEENAMGRFLKEAGKQDKTRAGKMMSAVGKSLSYSGQQRLALRAPLVRLYQEVETFRQRAIEDTLQNVQSLEKARTEYRAALNWMKNISQELDPDTTKQLEKFRKVQTRVRRGKASFDNLTLDCLQKVDLLAAARCNMFSHALVLYQNTLLNFTKKSTQAYSTIANSFKGYQRYDFMVVRELAETSSKLARETGGDDDIDDKDKLLFFDEYHDSVEEAQEVKADEKSNSDNKKDDKLLDFENISQDFLENKSNLTVTKNGNTETFESQTDKEFEEFFSNLVPGKKETSTVRQIKEQTITELEKNLAELDLAMDSFNAPSSGYDFLSSPCLTPQTSQNPNQQQSPLEQLTSENIALLNDILNVGPSTHNEWDSVGDDTFLPPGILKQSLGDACIPIEQQKKPPINEPKTNKTGKKANPWLDLFAELDPLANNSLENLSKINNAPA